MADRIEIQRFSDADIEVLKGMVEAERNRRRNTTGRSTRDRIEDEEMLAPEVYIARVPAGGIPALVEESGAGIEDTPGQADCDVYQVVRDNSTTSHLEKIAMEKLTVLNLST